MKQPDIILPRGTKIITHDNLESSGGMMVAPHHISARKPGLRGIIDGVVAGHGGDVYWIKHEDGSIGSYCFTEFELDPGGNTMTRFTPLPQEALPLTPKDCRAYESWDRSWRLEVCRGASIGPDDIEALRERAAWLEEANGIEPPRSA